MTTEALIPIKTEAISPPLKLEAPKKLEAPPEIRSREDSVDSQVLVIDEKECFQEKMDVDDDDDEPPPILQTQPRADEMEQVIVAEPEPVQKVVESQPPAPAPLPAVLTPSGIKIPANVTPLISSTPPANLVPVTTISFSAAEAAISAAITPSIAPLATPTSTTATTTTTKQRKRQPKMQNAKKNGGVPQQVQQVLPQQIMIQPGMQFLPQMFGGGKVMIISDGRAQNGQNIQRFVPAPVQGVQSTSQKKISPANKQPQPTNGVHMQMQSQMQMIPPGFQMAQPGPSPTMQMIRLPNGQIAWAYPSQPKLVKGNDGQTYKYQNGTLTPVSLSLNPNQSVAQALGHGGQGPSHESKNGNEEFKPPKQKKKKSDINPKSELKSPTFVPGRQVFPNMVLAYNPHNQGNLMATDKTGIPIQLSQIPVQEAHLTNGNGEDKPPVINQEQKEDPVLSAKNRELFIKEAKEAKKYQPDGTERIHYIDGFKFKQHLNPPEVSDFKLHNFINSPQSSAPSTPSISSLNDKPKSFAKSPKAPPTPSPIITTIDTKKLVKKTKVDDHSNSYSKPIETPKIPPKPKELPVSSPRGRKPLNKEKDNKKVKSADNTPQPMAEKKKGKKNRELEGLLNMDFGKENPFKTTSLAEYSENIQKDQQTIQKLQAAEPRVARAVPPTRRPNPTLERPKRATGQRKRPAYDESSDEDDEKMEVEAEPTEGRSTKNLQFCCKSHRAAYTKTDGLDKSLADQCAARAKELGASRGCFEKEESMSIRSSSSGLISPKPTPSTSTSKLPSTSTVSSVSTSPKIEVKPSISSSSTAPESSQSPNDKRLVELESLPIEDWEVDDLYDFAKMKTNEIVAQNLKNEEFDGCSLMLVLAEQNWAEKLPLKTGPAFKIRAAIDKLKTKQANA